jgi:tetratricopeptide (TPR) repeat protein
MKNLFLFFILGCIAACNSGKSYSSKFEEILNQPAFSSITDSIKKESNRDDLYFRRAVLLNKNNLPEPALADFRKAWSLQKEEVYAVGVSNILLEKNADSAILFINEALKAIPQSLYLQLTLARSYDALNKTDEAIATCASILKIDSAQVNTLVMLADLQEKKNDLPAMIRSLEKAYRILPANLELGHRLAYQYAETKNSKALSLADSLVARDTQKIFAQPYYVKGTYFVNTGDKAKAMQWFNTTIQKDHNFLNAYIEKGKLQLDEKKTTEAFKTFELANRVKPAFPDAWYWMGYCQELLGQKEQAKLNYEKAYGLDKTFTEAKEAAEKLGK